MVQLPIAYLKNVQKDEAQNVFSEGRDRKVYTLGKLGIVFVFSPEISEYPSKLVILISERQR